MLFSLTILFGFDSAGKFFTFVEFGTIWIDGLKFDLVLSISPWIRLFKKDP